VPSSCLIAVEFAESPERTMNRKPSSMGIAGDKPRQASSPVARWDTCRRHTRLDLSSCVVLDSLGRVNSEVIIMARSWPGAAPLLRDLAIQPPHVGDFVRTTTLPRRKPSYRCQQRRRLWTLRPPWRRYCRYLCCGKAFGPFFGSDTDDALAPLSS
jgi:hypothetical protein